MKTPCLTLLLAAGLGGCSLAPELPRHFLVDDSLTHDSCNPDPAAINQLALISEAAEAWNVVCRAYVGRDCLINDGLINVPDGFSAAVYGDDLHVVYRGIDDEFYREMASGHLEGNAAGVNGNGTLEDVVLFTFQIATYYFLDGVQAKSRPTTPQEYHDTFLATTAHELGHFLGLTHVTDDRNALMYVSGAGPNGITPRDIQAFCNSRGDCIQDPPR